MRSIVALACAVSATACSFTLAGPYTEAGVPSTDPAIVGWATGATVTRGPQVISTVGSPAASYGAAGDAIGPVDGVGVVSLGDGGSATLTFASPIRNGPGADFAVFENTFAAGTASFAELAFVEVSSDGANFTRFPAISLTQTATQVASFGTIDPTDVFNLAGKHATGEGTPFDLAVLAGTAGLNLAAITHVRVVDVVGSINPTYARTDSLGNIINDPFPTNFPSSGFDLDGVAVLNVPEPTALAGMVVIGFFARRRRS